MYDIEKRSTALENVAGFTTRRVYSIRFRNKMVSLGYAIH